jgi:hypothetical protein
VRLLRSPARAQSNADAAKRVERNGPPLVSHDGHRHDLAGLAVDELLGECNAAGEQFGLADRGLDRGDRVVLVRGQRQVPTQLVLAPVVGAGRDPPDSAVSTGHRNTP